MAPELKSQESLRCLPWRSIITKYRRILEPDEYQRVLLGLGALPGTYLHHPWMHARYSECNKCICLFFVRWFIPMNGRWSGRKDMADPMLSPRQGATESCICPTRYLQAHNSVEATEALVRKLRETIVHKS